MPIPLFPRNDSPIFIEQGATGDCYLLAALDCIFNGGNESAELIKSLFTPSKNGVEVRLKCTDQHANLKPMKLRGKYSYYFDKDKNEDVFFINWARLREIDHASEGVKTNSLAVKILERLSSYYYKQDWGYSSASPGLRRVNSVSAHNLKNRYDDKSSIFAAKLLNVSATTSTDIDTIIKLKMLFPEYPVYMGMDYGKPDAYGKIHTSHALRIDKILPDRHNPDNYYFVLVNPWNNQKREMFSLDDIRHKNCDFCFFQTNPKQYEYIQKLLTRPILLNTLCQIKKLNTAFSPQEIEYCILLHQHRPEFPTIYTSLSSASQWAFISYLSTAKSDLGHQSSQEIIHSFDEKINEIQLTQRQKAIEEIALCAHHINQLTVQFDTAHSLAVINAIRVTYFSQLDSIILNNPNLYSAERVLGVATRTHHRCIEQALADKKQEVHTAAQQRQRVIRDAQETIARCIHKINTLPVSFETLSTLDDIEQHRRFLLAQLTDTVEHSPQLTEATATIRYPHKWFGDVEQALTMQSNHINYLAEQARKSVRANKTARQFLETTHFSMYLSQIGEKAIESQIKSDDDDTYHSVAILARNLHTQLEAAKNELLRLHLEAPIESRLIKFKSKCLRAIDYARPLLVREHGWRQVLADTTAILSSITIKRENPTPIRQLGWFSVRVQYSNQITNETWVRLKV